MQIRAAVYRLFPNTPPRELDQWELWQIGVRLGNDVGAGLSEDERAELAEINRIRSERMREARDAMRAR